jgi:hypothetical protein
VNETLKRLHQIGHDLQLTSVNQEWGIENADPRRVNEFIDFFYTMSSEPKTVQYNLADLIAASIWEAMEQGNMQYGNKKIDNFFEFIRKDSYFEPLVVYWASVGLIGI